MCHIHTLVNTPPRLRQWPTALLSIVLLIICWNFCRIGYPDPEEPYQFSASTIHVSVYIWRPQTELCINKLISERDCACAGQCRRRRVVRHSRRADDKCGALMTRRTGADAAVVIMSRPVPFVTVTAFIRGNWDNARAVGPGLFAGYFSY